MRAGTDAALCIRSTTPADVLLSFHQRWFISRIVCICFAVGAPERSVHRLRRPRPELDRSLWAQRCLREPERTRAPAETELLPHAPLCSEVAHLMQRHRERRRHDRFVEERVPHLHSAVGDDAVVAAEVAAVQARNLRHQSRPQLSPVLRRVRVESRAVPHVPSAELVRADAAQERACARANSPERSAGGVERCSFERCRLP
mmetsp:Transcript_5137/g.17924  ORF Transcript_5137/g.17924 Transcript_5137/m.17924 type:complete len:202 (+) Transcript_5137:1083-1688(+)